MEVVINTPAGQVKGLAQAEWQEFLGVRYAKAPVGELRFQPPQRIDRWKGVYDATRYGAIAPQAYPDTPPVRLAESEDCLNLNIYTPAADDMKRPVMVYIHGGGFLIDSGSRPRTHGGALAATGDVVVVTIDYRMGAYGFLYATGISPNLGLQDQVCALEWVQRNIASLGGDPGNVTIFGESAGGTSVAYLLVMPSAEGLFHRAILESGAFPLESQAENRRLAQEGTQKFFDRLKIAAGDLAALQAAPHNQIMQTVRKVAGNPLMDLRAFYPVIDGAVIPDNIYGGINTGWSREVPIIVGFNTEELPLFDGLVKSRLLQPFLAPLVRRKVRSAGIPGVQIRELLSRYREALRPSGRTRWRAYNHLISDLWFRIPATIFAEAKSESGAEVYFYFFDHPAAEIDAAMHVLELYFVFGSLGTDDIAKMMRIMGDEDERRLSHVMMAAWCAFARNGDPNGPGLPHWPTYDLERRATMSFELEPKVVDAPWDGVRAAWMESLEKMGKTGKEFKRI